MDARGPTSESTEEIILCIGAAITLSSSTAGQVRTDSSQTYWYRPLVRSDDISGDFGCGRALIRTRVKIDMG